ncbi:carbamoyl-phosphate synthase (glutamine-hydrolyzing) cpa2 [Actinomortierella ambigua]|nr:carbamoyl-phosphate synthase (glutamine-hydrolyzing) cpa2 [Actinomortierella ambigua]
MRPVLTAATLSLACCALLAHSFPFHALSSDNGLMEDQRQRPMGPGSHRKHDSSIHNSNSPFSGNAAEDYARFDNHRVYRVQISSMEELKKLEALVEAENLDLWTNLRIGTVDVRVPADKVALFEEATSHFVSDGLSSAATVMIPNLQDLVPEQAPSIQSAPIHAWNFTDNTFWTQYHDLATLNNFTETMIKDFPQLCKRVSIGKTFEGREVFGMVIHGYKDRKKDKSSHKKKKNHHSHKKYSHKKLGHAHKKKSHKSKKGGKKWNSMDKHSKKGHHCDEKKELAEEVRKGLWNWIESWFKEEDDDDKDLFFEQDDNESYKADPEWEEVEDDSDDSDDDDSDDEDSDDEDELDIWKRDDETELDERFDHLWKLMKLPKLTRKPSKPRKNPKGIVIHGGQHAREWIAPAVVTYLAKELILGYHKNKKITRILDQFEFTIVPVLNADGYAYTWEHNRMWRKNREPTSVPFCPGIDPNRNWGYKWNTGGSSNNPCNEGYHGPSAFAAAEPRMMADYIKKKDNVVGYIDFHAYSQLWMSPFGADCNQTPKDEEDILEGSIGAAKALYDMHGKKFAVGSVCNIIYQASGGSLDWTYAEGKVKYSYAVELRDTGRHGFLLPEEEILPSGEETTAAVVYLMNFIRLREKQWGFK